MSADTILVAIGDVAALATALFAFLALGKASETVREAKAARVDAEQAARDVGADRLPVCAALLGACPRRTRKPLSA
jgi:hypothetical protein